MAKVYGYARVSTKKQSIDRQIDNIKAFNPDAEIYQEKFTGTTLDRPEFNKLMKRVKAGDTIVFDEISRMSREAVEGFNQYKTLYEKGVNLVFLKERTLDTDNFKQAMMKQLEATGNEITDYCIGFVNGLMMKLAEQQIKAAFAAAQHEVDFIHKRTVDGMKAHHAGQKISEARTGNTYATAKNIAARCVITDHFFDLGKSISDAECMKLAGVSRGTYYKIKADVKEQMERLAKE